MNIEQLLTLMSMLRDAEHGCPWDRQQDFKSIAPHTLEEVYEVIDTIEREDYAHLQNELGDLLFQVVFYAQLGKEVGLFDFNNIVEEITRKLLHRHPHVFPNGTLESFGQPGQLDARQVEANWELIKQQERAEKPVAGEVDDSVLQDIPLALPALSRARKLQKRAAGVGFDWARSRQVLDKLKEEISELEEAMDAESEAEIRDEFGDVLFSAVNLGRHLKQDSETCLRQANQKFEQRFRKLEKLVSADNKSLQSLSLDELEQYWQQVKNSAWT